MSAKSPLDALRREIDAIDDAIHDLIMERTKVVERVREAKRGQPVKIRPARECSILYRLIGRHKGPFPKRELARIWRELIVATLSFEGPFSIAVHTPGDSEPDEPRHDRRSGRWNMARDHFGSFTPIHGISSARRLVDAVRTHEATVGVLALPGLDDNKPWWPHLASTRPDTPRITTRLPFIGSPEDRGPNDQALVICPVAAEPTGRDNTYLVVETTDQISLERLTSSLKKARMEPRFTASWNDPDTPARRLYLAEVEGFITDDDQKIIRLSEQLEGVASSIMSIGSYGLPLTPEELETEK
ncbi:MAG: chorismate mutase [Rhodospirillaceae bacterium]|nr:chorismate mutase [Rhodospirillaceae bacterium]MBL6942672.1 chorismate mutase [Rhodospirillales bacterium]